MPFKIGNAITHRLLGDIQVYGGLIHTPIPCHSKYGVDCLGIGDKSAPNW